MTPDDLLFTKEHEWLRITGDTAIIGISDNAQKQLGDIIYVELPKPGTHFKSGETFGSVESVKAVSELFSPVSCEVVEVNDDLGSSPENVNEAPYGAGWMIRVRLLNPDETGDLMSAEEYDEYTAEEKE